jgi:predicted dithiol-disulfide oxidoreductase (DUF899 family)
LRDELSQERRALPWERVEESYVFDGPCGKETLGDLFAGRGQLAVYHFMMGPEWAEGCPGCSFLADHFDGCVAHLAARDVTLVVVSRAPAAAIEAFKKRMGWKFKWVSSLGSDFNFDYGVSFTEEQQREGGASYNFRETQPASADANPFVDEVAAMTGTDALTYMREGPGISAFILEDGVVYHTYSAYARGVDAIWGMYPWLDRAPKGRNETGPWFRRKDEYGKV